MDILFCNFTGIYELEGITDRGVTIDLSDLPGTDMYIDEESEQEIKRRLEAAGASAFRLRFLDNGNYHYMTRILASSISGPFDLITFDHHTDDQPPAFEGARSCGSWRMDIAAENKNLRRSMLIRDPEGFERAYIPSDLPLYISIDKDILSPDVLITNWDQGDMTSEQLFELLRKLFDERQILALDICGEDLPGNPYEDNRSFNLHIINLIGSIHS